MKNWKQSVFFGVVVIIALGFGFIGCDDKSEVEVIDYPKNQSTPTNFAFTFGGISYPTTVTGHMTDTEWNAVLRKIAKAIDDAFTASSNRGDFRGVFVDGVTIIVERTPSGYTKWKTSADGTMWLAFGKLDDNLQGTINDAIMQMAIFEAGNG